MRQPLVTSSAPTRSVGAWTQGAKAQLHENVELRARLTGDVGQQAEQQQEIAAIEIL